MHGLCYCVCAVEQEPASSTTETAELDTEAEDFEVEDPGLYDLARRLTEHALQGASAPSPSAPAMATIGNGKHLYCVCCGNKLCASLEC